MADFVFNCAKGKAAEKVADATTSVGILLIKTAESDASMKDRATIAAVLSGSTEADFTNYARKTGVTGTVTVDNTNDRTDVACTSPQTWASAGGATNNTLAKLIVFLDEGGTDSTRIPLVGIDCVITTDGNNLVVTFNASGFFRAA
jgi:hypothetical protein